MKNGTKKEVTAKKCKMPKSIVPLGTKRYVKMDISIAKMRSLRPLKKYILRNFSLEFL
jgi:hypothetical protein